MTRSYVYLVPGERDALVRGALGMHLAPVRRLRACGRASNTAGGSEQTTSPTCSPTRTWQGWTWSTESTGHHAGDPGEAVVPVSWLRFSDDILDWPQLQSVSAEAFKAYVALVGATSRVQAWDGRLARRRALAAILAYDDDPQARLEELCAVGPRHRRRDDGDGGQGRRAPSSTRCPTERREVEGTDAPQARPRRRGPLEMPAGELPRRHCYARRYGPRYA